MVALPENFHALSDQIVKNAKEIEGFLTEREMRFLVMLGSCPTADGSILEIGSFKGKSTYILSKSSGLCGSPEISAIDPLTSPSSTDPNLKGKASGWDDFKANLETHGVFDHVDFHRKTSGEVAECWDNPLRLLWIDGDHTYKGVKSDFDNFAHHVNDNGIIAMHDVIQQFDGGIRVFCEDILLSDHFGPCGLVGTIGWAQYFSDPEKTVPYRKHKLDLYRKLVKLIPYIVFNQKISGFRKFKYKFHRALVPHSEISPEAWLDMIQ